MYVCSKQAENARTNPLCTWGKKLAYQDKVEYGGFNLDKRLMWSKHVNERINKCSYLLKKISSVGREVNLTPAKIKWAYTATIKPKLLYGR